MKIWAYRTATRIELLSEGDTLRGATYLGTIEVDPPKKTVMKEAVVYHELTEHRGGIGSNLIQATYRIPANAKNIKCTYEVEE